MDNKTVMLTLEDRYNILKYAYQIPCTLTVRANFDKFAALMELDEEESKTYSVTVDESSIKPSDRLYIRKYETKDFPEIYEALASYTRDITASASGENPDMDPKYVEGITKWLNKLVG